jgi:hypothetical protein
VARRFGTDLQRYRAGRAQYRAERVDLRSPLYKCQRSPTDRGSADESGAWYTKRWLELGKREWARRIGVYLAPSSSQVTDLHGQGALPAAGVAR